MASKKPSLNENAKNLFTNLSITPFTSSTELTIIRGYKSEYSVYNAIRALEACGFVSSVQHSPINATRPTKRFS